MKGNIICSKCSNPLEKESIKISDFNPMGDVNFQLECPKCKNCLFFFLHREDWIDENKAVEKPIEAPAQKKQKSECECKTIRAMCYHAHCILCDRRFNIAPG